MMNQLSFATAKEVRRLQILISQRLRYIENQLELFNAKYPRSSGSDLIVQAYTKEKEELLSIKDKLFGEAYQDELI